MQRKNLGGLTITTTKNSITISDDSFNSPVRFEFLKYLHFIKTNEIYLFTNSINDLFALFLYEKKAYYVLIQRNVSHLYVFQEEKSFYVIGIYHNISIYSFEKILNKFMDIAMNEEIDEITAIAGSPKKNIIRVPFEDMCILSKSISSSQNCLEIYDKFLLIRTDVIQSSELQEITILHLESFLFFFSELKKPGHNFYITTTFFHFMLLKVNLKILFIL